MTTSPSLLMYGCLPMNGGTSFTVVMADLKNASPETENTHSTS